MDTDCTTPTPYCNKMTMTCVSCLSNTNCSADGGGIAPYCDTTTDTCVRCLTNDNCPAGTPTCSPTLHVCY
jgi:hypothetical protein